jgi:hypothetical protein
MWLGVATDASIVRGKGDPLMSKVRLVFLSLVAVISFGAMLASSASAAIEFKWKVGGAELKAGESKEFTTNNDEKRFTLHGVLAGAAALLLSTLVDVLPGARIIGGVPGTNLETALFLNVTVDGTAGVTCLVLQSRTTDQVQTLPLKTEIVEGASGGTGNNEVLILFVPEGGGPTFATFELSSRTGQTCPLNGLQFPVTGSILALPLPQKTEVLRQNLVFEANTKEFRLQNGNFDTAGLFFAGKPASLEGLVLVILNSDQSYGPF